MAVTSHFKISLDICTFTTSRKTGTAQDRYPLCGMRHADFKNNMKDISKIIACIFQLLTSCCKPENATIVQTSQPSKDELKAKLNNSLSKSNTDSIIFLSKMLLDAE